MGSDVFCGGIQNRNPSFPASLPYRPAGRRGGSRRDARASRGRAFAAVPSSHLGGQSSGGHLAAAALTTVWPRDFGLPADIIKGGMCISGMYDPTPVRLSARNAYVAFDDATVAALSPIRHLDRIPAVMAALPN